MNTRSIESERQLRWSKTTLRLVGIIVLLLVWAVYAYQRSGATVDSVPARSNVQAMQLVAPSQGWALTDEQLLWTADGGRRWSDITPHGVAAGAIQGVFFLDTGHGWSVAVGAVDSTGVTTLEAHRTLDGGTTWQSSPLADASLRYFGAGPAYVHFVDAQHGWVVVRLQSSSNFNLGALFQTTDGGATWRPLDIPVGGPVRFVSAMDGWAAGGPLGDQLYVTRDGGQSWQPQTVALPDGYTTSEAVYDVPTFQNARDGVLPVTLVGGNSGVAFYATHDGGASWSLATTIAADAPDLLAAGIRVPTKIIDAQVWTAALPGGGKLHLTPDGGNHQRAVVASGLPGGVEKLEFANSADGWALASYGRCTEFKTRCTTHAELLATRDGGQTWTVVNP